MYEKERARESERELLRHEKAYDGWITSDISRLLFFTAHKAAESRRATFHTCSLKQMYSYYSLFVRFYLYVSPRFCKAEYVHG